MSYLLLLRSDLKASILADEKPLYLSDGTKLAEGLASFTAQGMATHGKLARDRITWAQKRLTEEHPDTRIARIAFSNMENAYKALREYDVIMKHIEIT